MTVEYIEERRTGKFLVHGCSEEFSNFEELRDSFLAWGEKTGDMIDFKEASYSPVEWDDPIH